MLEDYRDVLTVEEACEALRIGYNTLYELLNSIFIAVLLIFSGY